ncbi:MAG TPA: hypothetical protein VMT32_10400 [Bryobacteraceae bacterium]|nr:hypothetical protein [Bryobacteraceae bacterium]
MRRAKAKGKRQRAKGKSWLSVIRAAAVAPHELDDAGTEGADTEFTFAFCPLPFAFCLL